MKKETFKLKTHIGQTVYEISIGVRSANSMRLSTKIDGHGIFVKKLEIVYQTPYKIALSGDWIPVIDRQKEGQRKESYKTFLDDVSVRIVTKETYFANGVFGHCYTLNDPQKVIKSIKQKMIDRINSDYGFLRYDLEGIINGFEINL